MAHKISPAWPSPPLSTASRGRLHAWWGAHGSTCNDDETKDERGLKTCLVCFLKTFLALLTSPLQLYYFMYQTATTMTTSGHIFKSVFISKCCFKGWVFTSKIPCLSHVRSWLFGNPSINLQSFSMSARTDNCRCRKMGSEKFGGLKCLRSAYHDGHLETVKEAWMEIDPDFGTDK